MKKILFHINNTFERPIYMLFLATFACYFLYRYYQLAHWGGSVITLFETYLFLPIAAICVWCAMYVSALTQKATSRWLLSIAYIVCAALALFLFFFTNWILGDSFNQLYANSDIELLGFIVRGIFGVANILAAIIAVFGVFAIRKYSYIWFYLVCFALAVLGVAFFILCMLHSGFYELEQFLNRISQINFIYVEAIVIIVLSIAYIAHKKNQKE